MLIGIGHEDGVGKSTAAKMLLEMLPGHRISSFASAIKTIAADLWGWAGVREESFYESVATRYLKDVRLPLIGKTPREVWIEVGESGRRVDPSTWYRRAVGENVVIPDVRKRNEADYVRASGGYLLLLERDGVESEGNRVSELKGFCEWDWRVQNNGSLADLRQQLETIVLGLEVCEVE